MKAWLSIGDKCLELSEINTNLIKDRPGWLRKISFEYLIDLDVTLLYINGIDADKLTELAYDSNWFSGNFIPFNKGQTPLDPMSKRIFLSTADIDLVSSMGLKSYLNKPLSNGLCPMIIQLKQAEIDSMTIDQAVSCKQVFEIFQDVKVPGDYNYFGNKKYSIYVEKYASLGIKLSGPINFDSLHEIKDIFRQMGWRKIASGSYSPWDSFDIDLDSIRLIEQISIPYLLGTDIVVKY
ncbi:hypothetical protein SPSYN_01175 [Sporotomaculum syntrophicum]|uniref:Uncharacterized protein n=1 Tax=Sporotomaculum syntrophicum TaxID=182264 RepID=A0A9D2WPM3_9FIRM|nr:hypothetical protein [Sporotomaculum syntrophicum]KAF1085039.1 hypothetical protein SPSYN_01175 [Sporotomaculum syntrophicum]